MAMFVCSDNTKFLDRHGIEMTFVDPIIAGQHVGQLQNNLEPDMYFMNNSVHEIT